MFSEFGVGTPQFDELANTLTQHQQAVSNSDVIMRRQVSPFSQREHAPPCVTANHHVRARCVHDMTASDMTAYT